MKAREAMIALPGHAAYLKNEIERALRNEIDGKQPDFMHERRVTFAVLGELRSPDCVALLGKYLEDQRDPWKDVPRGEWPRSAPNRTYAQEALEKMEIEGIYPPRTGLPWEQSARADLWKIWMAQVRSGVRTYRFKGGHEDYGIDGPVDAERIPPLEISQPFLPAPHPDEVAWIEKRQLEKAVEDWREFVKDTARNPTRQAVMKLARGFYDKRLEKELLEELWAESSDAFRAIPNHADFVEAEIRSVFEAEMIAAAEFHTLGTIGGRELNPSGMYSMRSRLNDVLASQHTPDCVRMVCKFLDDDRNPWGYKEKTRDTNIELLPPFSMWAGNALACMLVEPLPPTTERVKGDQKLWLRNWRKWRDQLKSGVRTYHFKGETQRYDLNGPVSPFVAVLPPSVPDSWKPTGWWIALAGVELGAVLALVGLKRRKRILGEESPRV
ncbi:hypothetical protein [Haloferula sp. BvORR071]|uniref:hypothetical protein n=1 Tax=Haloferula sp. BvORR071 TaxID=1396141 RepID=UPI002241034D|nr:hypothetical protein [Haloferula sp. BvORR071]